MHRIRILHDLLAHNKNEFINTYFFSFSSNISLEIAAAVYIFNSYTPYSGKAANSTIYMKE